MTSVWSRFCNLCGISSAIFPFQICAVFEVFHFCRFSVFSTSYKRRMSYNSRYKYGNVIVIRQASLHAQNKDRSIPLIQTSGIFHANLYSITRFKINFYNIIPNQNSMRFLNCMPFEKLNSQLLKPKEVVIMLPNCGSNEDFEMHF